MTRKHKIIRKALAFILVFIGLVLIAAVDSLPVICGLLGIILTILGCVIYLPVAPKEVE